MQAVVCAKTQQTLNMQKKDYSGEYRTEVARYMDILQEKMVKEYGVIEDEWEITMDLLAYDYQILLDCRDAVKKDGLMLVDTKGRMQKNPLLATINNIQAQINKITQQFALTLVSKARLPKDVGGEDVPEFLKVLGD